MMALSPLNPGQIGPAAPATPPGVALPVATFDLFMPTGDAADPRHEPAAAGKEIGKDVPVGIVDSSGPLAWLIPPIVPPVSAPVSLQHGEVISSAAKQPVTSGLIATQPTCEVTSPTVHAAAADTAAPVVGTSIPASLNSPAHAAASVLPATVPSPGRAADAVPPAPIPATVTAPPKSSDRNTPELLGRAGHNPSVEIDQPAPAPVPLGQLSIPRIAPAALVFADAMHRATRDDRTSASPEAATLAAAADLKTHTVAAASDAQHGALDLDHEQWPTRMMERIEALRDAANANDTSIRLIPDALGKIDVSLKRDGDTVAVHFAAHHAETRQLLADAAPKLAELAEARGLKLAQGGTDTAGQQQHRQQPITVSTAAAAPQRAITDDAEPTDIRIA